jgi:hypothetical protein
LLSIQAIAADIRKRRTGDMDTRRYFVAECSDKPKNFAQIKPETAPISAGRTDPPSEVSNQLKMIPEKRLGIKGGVLSGQ